jgi:hypothetical protein
MAETIAPRRRDDRREQAEELRRAAGTVHSASLREILIEIADEYERTAVARRESAASAASEPSGKGRA